LARYFFHLQSAHAVDDIIGTELVSLQAAKCLAVQYMVEHLCHQPEVFWDTESCEVRVTDEAALTLLTVNMMATVSPVTTDARKAA
jgi:hypothetical protein